MPYPPGLVPELIAGRRELLLLKKNFDVFTNPNTEAVLEALDPDEVILFGVATDVCDDAAILGLLRRGRRVRFVEDAARGLDEERVATCTAAWREGGVAFTTTDDVVNSLLRVSRRACRSYPRARLGELIHQIGQSALMWLPLVFFAPDHLPPLAHGAADAAREAARRSRRTPRAPCAGTTSPASRRRRPS